VMSVHAEVPSTSPRAGRRVRLAHGPPSPSAASCGGSLPKRHTSRPRKRTAGQETTVDLQAGYGPARRPGGRASSPIATVSRYLTHHWEGPEVAQAARVVAERGRRPGTLEGRSRSAACRWELHDPRVCVGARRGRRKIPFDTIPPAGAGRRACTIRLPVFPHVPDFRHDVSLSRTPATSRPQTLPPR